MAARSVRRKSSLRGLLAAAQTAHQAARHAAGDLLGDLLGGAHLLGVLDEGEVGGVVDFKSRGAVGGAAVVGGGRCAFARKIDLQRRAGFAGLTAFAYHPGVDPLGFSGSG